MNMSIITIIGAVVLLPFLYLGGLFFGSSSLKEEKNIDRKPFSLKRELLVMTGSELAIFAIWYHLGMCDYRNMTFELLYVMLVCMSIVCVTDSLEKVVPNKVLLITLMLFLIIVASQMIFDFDNTKWTLISIAFGFVFSLICFGLGYFVSKRSLGLGDVKLALVMGAVLTGEYAPSAILYGCLIAAVYCIVMLIRKKFTKTTVIAFVPFLYIGTILKYMVG